MKSSQTYGIIQCIVGLLPKSKHYDIAATETKKSIVVDTLGVLWENIAY